MIIKMARIRYGQTKEQIKDKVQELVKSLHIKTPWPDENHPQILDDATRIYNCNKTGFPLSPKPGKVITHKSDKHIYQAGTSSKKT